MAFLPSLIKKLTDLQVAPNAPITESLFVDIGGNINAIADFLALTHVNVVSFATPGSTSWVVPETVNFAFGLGFGGGGGGAKKAGFPNTANGGFGSDPRLVMLTPISPGDSVSITIGSGGAGATLNDNPGANGGDTIISHGSKRHIFLGGKGGGGTTTAGGFLDPSVPYSAPARFDQTWQQYAWIQDRFQVPGFGVNTGGVRGSSSSYASGGSGPNSSVTGGGGGFENGGNGGANQFNAGGNGGLGAGGGGGNFAAGGNGGSGGFIIFYVDFKNS